MQILHLIYFMKIPKRGYEWLERDKRETQGSGRGNNLMVTQKNYSTYENKF